MSIEFDPPFSIANKDILAEDMAAVYGDGGVAEISTVLDNSIEEALRLTPFKTMPNLKIRLGLSDNLPEDCIYEAGVYVKKEVLQITLNTNTSSDEITTGLPITLKHEMGHIAHNQYNHHFREWDSSHFGNAVREGVADLAAFPDFGSMCTHRGVSEAKGLEIALAGLRSLQAGEYNPMGKSEFLIGDYEHRMRGYFIGTYIVSSLQLFEGNNLSEIMELPLDHFRSFVETELFWI